MTMRADDPAPREGTAAEPPADPEELFAAAKELAAPYDLVKQVAETGKLPVVNFAAGGVATPADAALMMRLGADGVFVGSGIFKSEAPALFAKASVEAADAALARARRGDLILVKGSRGIATDRVIDRLKEAAA